MVDGPHNPGVQLDLAWLEQVRINLPAVLRRAGSYGTRRTVKQQWQAAWLLKAVTCIDLTTLAGDDTETNTARLCLKAARPVRKDLLQVGGQAETGGRNLFTSFPKLTEVTYDQTLQRKSFLSSQRSSTTREMTK